MSHCRSHVIVGSSNKHRGLGKNAVKRRNRINFLRLYPGLQLIVICGLFNNVAADDNGASSAVYPLPGNPPFPNDVYWGDTHVHTKLSYDGYFMSMAAGPEDAYRFAKGEPVMLRNGDVARLRRPLDFLVVADHAENLGLFARLEQADSHLLKSEQGSRLYELFQAFGDVEGTSQQADKRSALSREVYSASGSIGNLPYQRSVWTEVAARADRHNTPGIFTTFSGFEWTPGARVNAETSGSPHRVVIFKDDKDTVTRVLPFSNLDSENPEDLWRYMERYHQLTGGDALAILHNSNLSYGGRTAFVTRDSRGQPFTKGYAETRQRWEPLVEVTQRKGDSETHPILSPTDEFADFEVWETWLGSHYEKARLNETWLAIVEESVNREVLPYRYVRSALKLGLEEWARLGVNPLKFGLIGSTDSHSGLPAADNDNFVLKKGQHFLDSNESGRQGWEQAAAGYAGVWAEENTREALFAAMQRKEVYASTGPRITIRFFGGWNYQPDAAFRLDLAKIGYLGGVPMGADLTDAPEGRSPLFLIRAVRDPDGANLDRIQVIKGWRSVDGKLHEKVYNVALSDGRTLNRNGDVKPVGNTVDVKSASYTNTIGDPELAVVWQDPDFDGKELAFYYVRVLEIPTPRWTAYHAKNLGVDLDDIPAEVPLVTQERAYTSPIWYSP